MGKLSTGHKDYLAFIIPQVELLAGTKIDMVAPFDGYIEELQTVVQAAVTTGGAITVADAATKGTIQSDTPTTPSPTRQFDKGDLISIVPAAAFATAGAVNGNLLVRKSGTLDA